MIPAIFLLFSTLFTFTQTFELNNFLSSLTTKLTYPVPTPPGGRLDVHGWLLLPIQSLSDKEMFAWCSHHVPEFYEDSPHNFQIIALCTIQSLPHIYPLSSSSYYPLQPPVPPLSLDNEWTLTPPPPFSLNDLLNGDIAILQGTLYNGSFDTSYEREANNIASLTFNNLVTSNWLNYSLDVPPYPVLSYYSYPRMTTGNTNELYLSHAILVQPDYDQILYGSMQFNSCNCSGQCDNILNSINQPGIFWQIPNRSNGLDYRLKNDEMIDMLTIVGNNTGKITCPFHVTRIIHCMYGAGFDMNC